VKKDALELKFQYRRLMETSQVRQQIKRNTVHVVFSYVISHQDEVASKVNYSKLLKDESS